MRCSRWRFRAGETRNFDYKAPTAWRDSRADLAKDLVAFANTPDGGAIAIGIDNKTRAIDELLAAVAPHLPPREDGVGPPSPEL